MWEKLKNNFNKLFRFFVGDNIKQQNNNQEHSGFDNEGKQTKNIPNEEFEEEQSQEITEEEQAELNEFLEEEQSQEIAEEEQAELNKFLEEEQEEEQAELNEFLEEEQKEEQSQEITEEEFAELEKEAEEYVKNEKHVDYILSAMKDVHSKLTENIKINNIDDFRHKQEIRSSKNTNKVRSL